MNNPVSGPGLASRRRHCRCFKGIVGVLGVALAIGVCLPIDTISISKAASHSQVAGQPEIWFPFESGTNWIIVQGYNTTVTHTGDGYQKYALDLQVKRGNDQDQNGATEGQPLYAPVTGDLPGTRREVDR